MPFLYFFSDGVLACSFVIILYFLFNHVKIFLFYLILIGFRDKTIYQYTSPFVINKITPFVEKLLDCILQSRFNKTFNSFNFIEWEVNYETLGTSLIHSPLFLSNYSSMKVRWVCDVKLQLIRRTDIQLFERISALLTHTSCPEKGDFLAIIDLN